jgi:tRNA-2-methylthio-N6-dimethylallyladenosine synthase
VNKRDENKMTGRTRQNKLVHFATPELLRVGTYASVRIEDAARFHLSGTLVDVGALPTHKVHLSVQAVGQ